MAKRTILLIGGARSGKSSYAENLAREIGGQVLFVATAEARDDEMKTRITAHQKSRPGHWHTLEAPCNVGNCIARDSRKYDTVVFDCVTLLVNNILCQHMLEQGEEVNEKAIEEDVKSEIGVITDGMH